MVMATIYQRFLMINDIVETSNYIKGLTPIKRTTTKK